MTTPTADQAALQKEIGQVMQAVQGLWGATNPTAQQKGVVRLMLFALSLVDPAQEQRLNTIFNILAVLTGGGDKETALTQFMQEMGTDSSEYELCAYVLGDGNRMPSWPEVAARFTQIVIDEGVPPVTAPPAPTPTPAPAVDPATFLANLNGNGGTPAAAPATPATPAASPASMGPGKRPRQRGGVQSK